MSTTNDVTKTQNWGSVSDLLGQKSSTTDTSKTDSLANKDVFMQLMVAQLQHQNPMSPSDGVEFVTQLAQFTQLEQSMSTREAVEKIRDVMTAATATTDPAATKTTQP